MTTPLLITDLERFEGEPETHAPALTAYLDPGGVPTIGFGHTGPEVHLGLEWTYKQSLAALQADIAAIERELDLELPWWRALNDVRQDGAVNMAFNLGVHGFLEFHHMLAALQNADWQEAHDQTLASEWAEQVNGDGRATYVANLFFCGERL